MNWTKKDLEKVNLPHNLFDFEPKQQEKGKSISKKIKKISVEKEAIKKILWVLHKEKLIPDYVEELKFHPKRRFRFDWAIPDLKIAIEYEGLMSKKSRHTTITGFTNDTIKYNEAVKLGWRVLRYTALNYKNLYGDLTFFCKNL